MGTPEVLEEDMVIAVIGPTGTGKSTFIRLVTGKEIGIGHRLNSCTEDVLAVPCNHPYNPDQRVVFLDTPGFGDTTKTDVQVLQLIAKWLAQTYVQGIKLSGILYLHRISDNRMTGCSMRCFKLFRDLCGESTFRNVIMVTTMWSKVEEAFGTEREQVLRQEYWATLLACDAQVARHNDTREGGWAIVALLKDKMKVVTQLQHELVDQRRELADTTVGASMAESFGALTAKHRQEIRILEAEHTTALKRKDEAMAEALKKERDNFERRLQEVEEALEELRRPKGWLKNFANGVICVLSFGIFPSIFG